MAVIQSINGTGIRRLKKVITGELKNKIDCMWEIFWTGGLTNPLDVIEQMTYLMFIHDLDVSDNTHAKESAMLGLPYESVFAKEVKLERGLLMEHSLSGLFSETIQLIECIL